MEPTSNVAATNPALNEAAQAFSAAKASEDACLASTPQNANRPTEDNSSILAASTHQLAESSGSPFQRLQALLGVQGNQLGSLSGNDGWGAAGGNTDPLVPAGQQASTSQSQFDALSNLLGQGLTASPDHQQQLANAMLGMSGLSLLGGGDSGLGGRAASMPGHFPFSPATQGLGPQHDSLFAAAAAQSLSSEPGDGFQRAVMGQGLSNMSPVASASNLLDCLAPAAAAAAAAAAATSSASLYVKNLPPETTELLLYQKFAPHGALLSCKVQTDPITGKCRGVGFVNFVDSACALKAMHQLHGTRIAEGRHLHITLQAPRAVRAAAAAAAAAAAGSGGSSSPTHASSISGGLGGNGLSAMALNTLQQQLMSSPNPAVRMAAAAAIQQSTPSALSNSLLSSAFASPTSPYVQSFGGLGARASSMTGSGSPTTFL